MELFPRNQETQCSVLGGYCAGLKKKNNQNCTDWGRPCHTILTLPWTKFPSQSLKHEVVPWWPGSFHAIHSCLAPFLCTFLQPWGASLCPKHWAISSLGPWHAKKPKYLSCLCCFTLLSCGSTSSTTAQEIWQREACRGQCKKSGRIHPLVVSARVWRSFFVRAASTLQPPHLLQAIYSCKQSFIGLRWLVLNPVFKHSGDFPANSYSIWRADTFVSAAALCAPPAASAAPLVPA